MDGYDLHGLVRNDLYTLEWAHDRSTLEFGVGDVLEARYDFEYHERLMLEVHGAPQWNGDDSRLELVYAAADRIRVTHPVRIQPDQLRKQRQAAFTHTLTLSGRGMCSRVKLGRWLGLPPSVLAARGTHPARERTGSGPG